MLILNGTQTSSGGRVTRCKPTIWLSMPVHPIFLPPLEAITYVSYDWVLSVTGEGDDDPDGFELVQFSSGSTGDPKASFCLPTVLQRISVQILERLRPEPGDCPCTWLPLSHDMGLIGMFLSSVAGAGTIGRMVATW